MLREYERGKREFLIPLRRIYGILITVLKKEGVAGLNYERLIQKRDQYRAGLKGIPEYTLQTFEQAFEIEYTHNSTAIEGNTLTLIETRVLLEDGISIGGKRLR